MVYVTYLPVANFLTVTSCSRCQSTVFDAASWIS